MLKVIFATGASACYLALQGTFILCGVYYGVKVEAKVSCIVTDSDQFDIILGTPSIYGDEGLKQDVGKEARARSPARGLSKTACDAMRVCA